MSRTHFVRFLGILGAMMITAACAGVPATTRSGDIHDVKIEEGLTPGQLMVHAGDEVRWVNHRTMPVRIDLVGGTWDAISCQRGFTNWLGLKKQSVTLGANETASVCFSKGGTYLYNVRMDSALPGGRQITQGEVTVGKLASHTP